MQRIEFFVPGIPKPAGSKRVFINKKTGTPIVTDDCKTGRDWKADVKHFAFQEYQGPPLIGPLRLAVHFYMPRPKYHYGTGRNAGVLKASAPSWHTVKPDRTKLLRAVEDALTGVLWADDAQIVVGDVQKTYPSLHGNPGARLLVERMPEAR